MIRVKSLVQLVGNSLFLLIGFLVLGWVWLMVTLLDRIEVVFFTAVFTLWVLWVWVMWQVLFYSVDI